MGSSKHNMALGPWSWVSLAQGLVNIGLVVGMVVLATHESSTSWYSSGSARNGACITKAEVDNAIETWTQAVVAIGAAYQAGGCQKAKDAALGALGAAYAYGSSGPGSGSGSGLGSGKTVLFKPTLTYPPYVERPTLDGALSYFIGTKCMTEVGRFYGAKDPGFALGMLDGDMSPTDVNWPMNLKGWKKVTWGVSAALYPRAFEYRLGGTNCHSPTVQGPICFESNGPIPTALQTGNKAYPPTLITCVDKTFEYMRGAGDSKQLSAILTVHHSSVAIRPPKST